MCAADAFQQQSGDLSLAVELCLSDTKLMLCLQVETKAQERSIERAVQTHEMLFMNHSDTNTDSHTHCVPSESTYFVHFLTQQLREAT